MVRTASAAVCAAIGLAGLPLATPVVAQDSEQRLGTVHFQTSCNPTAQARFNRGMRYQHSFWFRSSQEVFEEVLKADPECAIAIGASR